MTNINNKHKKNDRFVVGFTLNQWQLTQPTITHDSVTSGAPGASIPRLHQGALVKILFGKMNIQSLTGVKTNRK